MPRIKASIFFPSCLRVLVVILLFATPITAAPPTSAPTSQPARAAVRFVPESADDIIWENDRIAFRVFGPALESKQKTGSGIDVWVKSTRNLVIDRWIKSADYRTDHGEGLDFYSVGESRGCGGLGIWNGKSLDVSTVRKSHKILVNGRDRVSFELTYAPWQSTGRKVWETRRITLEAGSNLNRIESTIDSDHPGDLTIGIGIPRRNADGGEATLIARQGIISYWQPPEGTNGSIACGVIVDPKTLVKLTDADGHYLALMTVTPGKPFTYYAGAGWSKSGDFADADAWAKYLREYPVKW